MFLDLITTQKFVVDQIPNGGNSMLIPIVAVVAVAIAVVVITRMIIKRELSNAKRV